MNRKAAQISASMMCADLTRITDTLAAFENSGVERLHIDIMDGQFVPNFTLGTDYIKAMRRLSRIPLDIHLMIQSPEYKLNWLGLQKDDIVSIHIESTNQIQRALDYMKPFGCARYVALNPATPLCMLEELLDYIDGVNLMMVNPGFAGQKIVPATVDKARRLRKMLDAAGHRDIVIEVDGNMTLENGRLLRGCGADMFVVGTSSVFRGDVDNYAANVAAFREAVSV